MIGKRLRKIIWQLFLIFYISRKKKSVQFIFQKIIRIVKKKKILNDPKWRKILSSHEKVYKNKDFCGIVMPSEEDSILEFNQYMKSDKMLYIISADIESLI